MSHILCVEVHPEHAGHEVEGRLQVGADHGLGGDPDKLLADEAEAPGHPDQVPGLAPGAVQHKHPALRPLKLRRNIQNIIIILSLESLNIMEIQAGVYRIKTIKIVNEQLFKKILFNSPVLNHLCVAL